ncbi:tektin-2 [Venturia canescens]|uniref:tektin-2 n=1 Tax=Venturia canescens TaxID=32260 RepID=UPI001C9CC99C|nr:tektin-2 [Venturia canescens]
MAKSVPVFEKPTAHLGLPDWYAKQWELQKAADVRRSDAFDLRHAARIIRDETKIRTEWDTYMNNTRLADRITEISRWHAILESLLKRIAFETGILRDEKADAEKNLEVLNIPLHITAQCISMRDCRRGTELTYDEPDKELKKELCVIENVRKLITESVQAAWQKLNRLEEVRFKVNLDLEDKVESIEIEKENLQLSRNSASISYKPDALRVVKGCIPYETWLEHCRYTRLLADNELSDTYNFRESMHVTRERASNDIRAQQDFTDFTLRKRIYQTQKARNELAWQKQKIQNEMELLMKELPKLEDALRNKIDAIKCVETRLENRTYRPGFELCRDEIEFGLKDEVLQLRQTKEDLTSRINSTRAAYNDLETLLVRIDRNLEDKEHSLMTDIKCLDLRSALKTGDRAKLPNETDRNIVLTKMEHEIPPES